MAEAILGAMIMRTGSGTMAVAAAVATVHRVF